MILSLGHISNNRMILGQGIHAFFRRLKHFAKLLSGMVFQFLYALAMYELFSL